MRCQQLYHTREIRVVVNGLEISAVTIGYKAKLVNKISEIIDHFSSVPIHLLSQAKHGNNKNPNKTLRGTCHPEQYKGREAEISELPSTSLSALRLSTGQSSSICFDHVIFYVCMITRSQRKAEW
jgi:hypothetical protein